MSCKGGGMGHSDVAVKGGALESAGSGFESFL